MRSTKEFFSILLIVCLCLQASTETSAQAAVADANEKALTLKWLGNAGWEIQFGETVILIDPFLTRGEASPGVEWKTDEQAVLKVIKPPIIFSPATATRTISLTFRSSRRSLVPK